MPTGLHIEFADGGPDMNILAGMRGLKYVGNFGSGGSAAKTFPDMVEGYQTYFMPYAAFRWIGNWVNGQLMLFSGYTVNGKTITQHYGGNNTSGGSFPGTVWQIDGSAPKSGLLISDSSDFTSIGNGSALGFCVYRGEVRINGSWTPPIPAGAVGVTVFAKFDSPGATLLYTGGAITSWGNNGDDTIRPVVTAKIVIFASGIAPIPQQGGLNMWNAAGECTFSSANRPFITYGKVIQLTRTNKPTGGDMVQLCSTGSGSHGQDQGNTKWVKGFGVSMGPDYVMVGWANEISKDTDWYAADETKYFIPGISVLAIPDIYV